ncbi:uncharacterized protein ACRADG_007701 [Cochliomyia hominivorax]
MESVLPICRVCLNASNETIDFQTRFVYRGPQEEQTENATQDVEEINYLECLRRCTNLPILEYDDGPQCLCTQCEAELQVVYNFLQKAQNSQAILEDNWQKTLMSPKEEQSEEQQHAEIVIETFEEQENFEEPVNDYEPLIKTEESSIEYYEEDKPQIDPMDAFKEENLYIETEEVSSDFEIDDSQNNQMITEDSNTSQENTKTFIAKNHKCHICDRVYTTPNLLKIHLNYHKRKVEENKAYQCKMCGEYFATKRYLNQHLVEQLDCQVTYKCEFCDKEYITKIALNSHKRMHQGLLFTCNECGKQFTGNYELTVHQRFHKREKEIQAIHKCEICDKEYTSSRYLNQHMIVHLGDRETYNCSYCDRVYVSKAALNNHIRLHEGQTLDCTLCGKSFTRNCELKIHMRFHNREYPYECELCDKKFAIKGHLKTHMLQHEGLKFECPNCGKIFSSSRALNEHSYTHSGEMPYPCDFCTKAFPTKQKYKIHLEKVHSTEQEDIQLIKIENMSEDGSNAKRHKNYTYFEVIEEPIDDE